MNYERRDMLRMFAIATVFAVVLLAVSFYLWG